MPHNQPDRRDRGFTLIEIMAVVLIIGMLTGMVGLAVWKQVESARVKTTRGQIQMLDAALEAYRMDNAAFPTSEQGLTALIQPPPEARNAMPGGYLREQRIPPDAWGRPFQYEAPGQHNPQAYDLWSLGGDGTPAAAAPTPTSATGWTTAANRRARS